VADITLAKLREALKAEGLELTDAQETKLLRAWRKLENPDGCPVCGQHVLVGVPKGKRGTFSACCNTKIG